MKNFVFINLLLILLFGCNEGTHQIKMVTPKQVYDAVYGGEEQDVQLIDVRTEAEYKVSHLRDAQNICVSSKDFREKVMELDKSKPVYVYCKGGQESAQAAEILKEMGFTKVYDLQGGIINWEENGLETVN